MPAKTEQLHRFGLNNQIACIVFFIEPRIDIEIGPGKLKPFHPLLQFTQIGPISKASQITNKVIQ